MIWESAAKYDASCSSSGTSKHNSVDGKGIGSTEGSGICHSYALDGRCIRQLPAVTLQGPVDLSGFRSAAHQAWLGDMHHADEFARPATGPTWPQAPTRRGPTSATRCRSP